MNTQRKFNGEFRELFYTLVSHIQEKYKVSDEKIIAMCIGYGQMVAVKYISADKRDEFVEKMNDLIEKYIRR